MYAETLKRLDAFGTQVGGLGAQIVREHTRGVNWESADWMIDYLATPAWTVGGGSSEIMRNVIAERVLGLPARGAGMSAETSEFRAELRATARAFLARRCPPAVVRAIGDGADDGAPLRRAIAGLGWFGVEVPEEHGGLGAGAPELVVLLEECGRALVPVPVLGPAALGVGALLSAPDHLRDAWLPRVASGDAVVTAALGTGVTARPAGGAIVLDGAADFVVDLVAADAVVVAAAADDGTALYLVPTHAAGMTVEERPVHDRTRRLARLVLDGLVAEPAWRLGDDRLSGLLADRGALAVAADCLGGAERALEITLDHLRTREQFGRPLGSFQALKHRCADMFLAVTAARGAVEHAAAVLLREDERAVAVSIAKACAGEAYAHVAAEGVQMHGGIGFTWEHDMHLHLKRAMLNEVLFGDGDAHRDRLDGVILPRPVA